MLIRRLSFQRLNWQIILNLICRSPIASGDELKSFVAAVWYDIMKLMFERKTRLGQTLQNHLCLGKRLCKMSLQENEKSVEEFTMWEQFLYKITR